MWATRASARSARSTAAAPELLVAHTGFWLMLGTGRCAQPACLHDLPGQHVRPSADARRTASATPSNAMPSHTLRVTRPAAPEHARTEAASHARRREYTERACGLLEQALAPRARRQRRLSCWLRIRGSGLCWGRAGALCLRACMTCQADTCGLAPMRAGRPQRRLPTRYHPTPCVRRGQLRLRAPELELAVKRLLSMCQW